MPRLILPTAIPAVKKIVTDIIAQNDAMGAESPLPLMLTENGIDLAADATAVANAETLDYAGAGLARSAENFTEIRNLKTEPAMKDVAGMAQLLKKFYKGKLTEVGKWGLTITASGKITYPLSAAGKQELVKNIETKHSSFPADQSPLTAYLAKENIVLGNLVTALTAARTYDEQSKSTAAEAEYDTAQRNILLEPVLKHISIIGGFLMDFYKGNPRTLGFWGFTVDENTQKPREQTTSLIAGQSKTISAAVLGGTLTNLGPGDIHLYKGKTTTGNPIIIALGGKFGIVKGYTTITVSNPSTLQSVKFKVLVAR